MSVDPRHTIDIELEQDYAPRIKLNCPEEGGCRGASYCSECNRTVGDDDVERCDCCPTDEEAERCWLRSWADAGELTEFVAGTIKGIPVDVTFNGDTPELKIVEAHDG